MVLLARMLLAAVFGVAGVSKLADVAGTRRSMADFGVPGRWTRVVAAVVPLAELACAAALGRASWARPGAVGAAALLVMFELVIAFNMVRGRSPDCHCFGQLHASSVGWSTLCRNAAFIGLAIFVATHGGRAADEDWTLAADALRRLGSTVPIWMMVLFAGWVLGAVGLTRGLRHTGPARQRTAAAAATPGSPARSSTDSQPALVELPVNAPAPFFALKGLDANIVTLQALAEGGQSVLLLFTRPNCPACDGVLPEVGPWQRLHGEQLVIAPISTQTIEANRAKASRYGLQNVLLQRDHEVSEAYGVQSLPSAVLVTDGRIASPIAEGRDAIRALVAKAIRPIG